MDGITRLYQPHAWGNTESRWLSELLKMFKPKNPVAVRGRFVTRSWTSPGPITVCEVCLHRFNGLLIETAPEGAYTTKLGGFHDTFSSADLGAYV